MAVMLNAKEMELLEYRIGEGTYADLVATTVQSYDKYLGRYQGPDKIMTVQLQDERLAVDIPGQMVFQLKDPDENGDWFFVLTDRASVSFRDDAAGKTTAMIINSRQRMPRDTEAEAVPNVEVVPEQYRSFVGRYPIPMQNVAFTIEATGDGLVLVYPGSSAISLSAGDDGVWIGDTGKSELRIGFESNAEGAVVAMRFSELVTCPRIE
jgi:hypothetical protein